MSIWHHKPTLEAINELSKGCMVTHVGIVFTDIGDDFLEARMPIDPRTRRPYGIRHGGASSVLAGVPGYSAPLTDRIIPPPGAALSRIFCALRRTASGGP